MTDSKKSKKKSKKKAAKKKTAKKTGLQTVDKNEIVIPQSSDPVISTIQMIERAAVNPEVDIDKMERLMNMQERMMDRNAETEFNIAMSNAQNEVGFINADLENGQTHSKYASYAQMDRALRPVYTKNGFALSFNSKPSEKENILTVLCYVTHKAGHSREYVIDMPSDGKGAKGGDVMTKTHATGAASSYGMRYLLKMIFNVAIGEEDTDGNATVEPVNYISDIQVNKLDSKIREHDVNMKAFLNWMNKELKIKSIETIPENFYKYVDEKIDAAIKANA